MGYSPVSASTSEEECEEPVLSPLGMVFVATAVVQGILIAFLIRKYLKLKKKSGSGTTSVAAPKPVVSEIPTGEEGNWDISSILSYQLYIKYGITSTHKRYLHVK